MVKIEINLYTSEIINDVATETYLLGESSRDGDNTEAVALVQSATDERNIEKIMRSVSSAYGNIYTALSDYISDDTAVSDNTKWDKDQNLCLVLLMPDNFNPAVTDTINSSAHEYVTNMAKGDWLTALKQDATDYYTKAASFMDMLKAASRKRLRPKRPLNTK